MDFNYGSAKFRNGGKRLETGDYTAEVTQIVNEPFIGSNGAEVNFNRCRVKANGSIYGFNADKFLEDAGYFLAADKENKLFVGQTLQFHVDANTDPNGVRTMSFSNISMQETTDYEKAKTSGRGSSKKAAANG